MSTLESKPVKAPKPLNANTLTIAAILLIVLALLFLASPLLGLNRGGRGTNFNRTFTGQNGTTGRTFTFNPGQGGTGTGGSGTGNGFRFGGTNGTNGRTVNRGGLTGLLALNFLRGTLGTVFYGIALLISLAAVIGMFILKNWGRILGIIMAVVYLLLAVLSFLPTLLFARFGAALNNPLGLALNVLHLVLALGVIIFALIPAKKIAAPAAVTTPPVAMA